VPIYDYVCGSCGDVVEVIHSIAATGPSACERCGGTMKRALSAPAIVFKGSGWAKKDARDASRAKTTAKGTDTAQAAESATGEATGPTGEATGPTSEATGPTGSSGPTGSGPAKEAPSTTPSTAATSAGTSGGSSAASG
jgi:putative FmdB family regulatory protein